MPARVGRDYRTGGIAVLLEAPLYYDAQKGLPLVGRNGKAFDELADAAELPSDSLLITHTVRHRIPNNRVQDYPEAVFACASWTAMEFEVYQPSVIIVMGRTALRSSFGAEASVGSTRGHFVATKKDHPWGARAIIATYNPQAASFDDSGEVSKLIVSDLKAAKRAWEVLSAR